MLQEIEAIDPEAVYGYGRHSTDGQDDGTTREVQYEAIELYCKLNGWKMSPDKFFYDDAYSGSNLNRPGITKLRQLVQEGKVKAIVVYKLDRLSRRLRDIVDLIQDEWREKCSFVSTKEKFDTNTAIGKMVLNILASFAEFERDLIRERTVSGKYKRADQGKNAGTPYPFGYKRAKTPFEFGGVAYESYALDGWDEENSCFTGAAAIVRTIFDSFLSGRGTRVQAVDMNQRGIPSPWGGKWTPGAVKRVLTNQAYCGIQVYGRKKRRVDETARWVNDGVIPPIVSKGEFDQANITVKSWAKEHPRRHSSSYLLSGVAKCSACGANLNGKSVVFKKGDPSRRYYQCSNSNSFGSCSAAMIKADELEQEVIERVRASINPDSIHQQVAEVEHDIRNRIDQAEFAVAEARKVVEQKERRLKKLESDYDAGEISGKLFEKQTDKTEAELANAMQQVGELEAALEEVKAIHVDTSHLQAVADKVDAWETLEPGEIKQLLRHLIDTMTVYRAPSGRHGTNPNDAEVTLRLRREEFMLMPTEKEQQAGD